MGSSTNKTTTTSGIANPDLNATVSKLAKGITAAYTPGASAYVAPGSATTGGWQASLNAAGSPDYSSGIAGALGAYGNRAAGNELGQNDPGYAALRAKLSNDVLTQTNASFNNSGMFGSDSNQKAAASGLADALGSLDYRQYSDSLNRQSEAATMLPQLFAANQLPSSIQQSVGASMDADRAAQTNGQYDYLAKYANLINGTAASGGTTQTTSTPTPPLWQILLGLGVSAL